MTFFQDLQKGFRFQMSGMFGESLRFENKEGEMTRFIRILGAGKTYNFPVDTDEELSLVPGVGVPVRASGLVVRRNGTLYVNPRIQDFTVPGKPNWKPPSEEDFLAGVSFAGHGILLQKRGGEYRGSEYRKIQVSGWGDTYEFRDISIDMFDALPDRGNVFVSGRLEPVLSSGRIDDRTVVASDMRFVVDKVRVVEAVVERVPKVEKPAA